MANQTISQDPYHIANPRMARMAKAGRRFIEPYAITDSFVRGLAYGENPSPALVRLNLHGEQLCSFDRTHEMPLNVRLLFDRSDIPEFVRDVLFHCGLKPQDLITGDRRG